MTCELWLRLGCYASRLGGSGGTAGAQRLPVAGPRQQSSVVPCELRQGCHSPASIASSHFFAFSAAQNPGVGRQPDSRRLRDRTLLLGLCVSTQAHVAAIRGAPPEEVYKMECSLGNVGAAQPDIAEPACADGVCVSSGPDSRSPDGAACVYSCEPAGCCTAGR